MEEAEDGVDGDPSGEDEEAEGVDEAGEHAGALVAEGALVGGGAALEPEGDEAEGQGGEVGDVVAGFGDQRERMGADAENERSEDVQAGEQQGNLQDARHGSVRLSGGVGVGGGVFVRVLVHRNQCIGSYGGQVLMAARLAMLCTQLCARNFLHFAS